MFRKVLIAVAALAVSACSYGSAVDIAPIKDRLAHPVVPAGYYCPAKGAQGAYQISADDDCAPLKWNGGQRTLTMIDKDDPKKSMEIAFVMLDQGLYAAQFDDPAVASGKAGALKLHQINLIIASGKAFTLVSSLDGDDLEAALKRHPKLTVGHDGKTAYIAAGEASEIKSFLRDAAGEALKQDRAKGDEVDVVVLDAPGKPEHSASTAQVRDIEAVKAIVAKLTPR
ncbi:MAG: hypothetical protein ABI740_06965 [Alphaproteobacteria bacterium]